MNNNTNPYLPSSPTYSFAPFLPSVVTIPPIQYSEVKPLSNGAHAVHLTTLNHQPIRIQTSKKLP